MTVLGRISVCLTGGLLTLAATPAHANQVPAATYTGTAATGGTVSFEVSAQGGSVTRFAWRGVPTECGTLSGARRRLPIIDHAFGTGGPFTTSVTGSFPATQQATGTLWAGPGLFGRRSCEPVGWTAATTTTGAPEFPDTTPPLIETRIGRKLYDGKGVRVWVYCPEENCVARVRGSVSIGRRGVHDFRLKRFEQPVTHGVHAFADADLRDRAADAVRRALRQARRVRARVTLTVTDLASNQTVKRFSIRLRRT